jgi:hypothetical protein
MNEQKKYVINPKADITTLESAKLVMLLAAGHSDEVLLSLLEKQGLQKHVDFIE